VEIAMPRLALASFALYLALAFGWRTWVQLRRTGASGFVGLPRTGVLPRLGGALLVLSIALGLLAPVAALAGWRWGSPLTAPLPLAGVALYVAGLALTLWAQLHMGASWRIGVDPSERTALVTGGPFALARNPIFTGMLAVAIALALVLPNAPSVLGALVLIVGLELQVRLVEEPYLIAQHGGAYLGWARRVGRFLPAIGRLR
jgi:protein-S-isoprenylcysteine O-methyltransferase Ste14